MNAFAPSSAFGPFTGGGFGASSQLNQFNFELPAVTGVVADPGDGTVVLTWDEYEPDTNNTWIYRSKGNNPLTATKIGEVGTAQANTFTATGLVNGTVYYFWVASYGNGGGIPNDPGAGVSVTPGGSPPPPPDPPSGIVATPGDGSITLTWDEVSGVTSYNIYNAADNTIVGGTPLLEYEITGLDNGTEYGFYIKSAADGSGEGLASATVTATPALVVATSYANPLGSGDRTGLVVVTTDLGHNGATDILVNGDVSGTGFYVYGQSNYGKTIRFDFDGLYLINEATWYQSAGSFDHGTWQWEGSIDGGTWDSIGAPFVLGLTGTDVLSELNGNTTPYRSYRMQGLSGNANGAPWLFEVEFKISTVYSLLIPTAFAVSERTAETIGFSFMEPSPAADAYDVDYSLTGANSWIASSTAGQSGLSSNTAYDFRIRSHNTDGRTSDWVLLSNVFTLPAAPSAPTASSADGGSSATITWDSITGALSYTVRQYLEGVLSNTTTTAFSGMSSGVATGSGSSANTWTLSVITAAGESAESGGSSAIFPPA
ncbi:MAG: exoglucanase [Verrucomicrobiaceae bacterium]|nr:exoglucanase [Verrucomicrobiaceae bacterium]